MSSPIKKPEITLARPKSLFAIRCDSDGGKIFRFSLPRAPVSCQFWNRFQPFNMNYICIYTYLTGEFWYVCQTTRIIANPIRVSLCVCWLWAHAKALYSTNSRIQWMFYCIFDVSNREKHLSLPGKYEFSFTIACKYLNSGKSRMRPPSPLPSPPLSTWTTT